MPTFVVPAGSKRQWHQKLKQRKGRARHRWIARTGRSEDWADTVVSIEREVVSGHDYAILVLGAVCGVRGGYDKPTFVSVDGG